MRTLSTHAHACARASTLTCTCTSTHLHRFDYYSVTPSGNWDGFKDLYRRLLDMQASVLPPVHAFSLRMCLLARTYGHVCMRVCGLA